MFYVTFAHFVQVAANFCTQLLQHNLYFTLLQTFFLRFMKANTVFNFREVTSELCNFHAYYLFLA